MALLIGPGTDDSSSHVGAASNARAEPSSIEKQYDKLRDKYVNLQTRLKRLKVLDRKLQESIKSVTSDMLAARDEYNQAIAAAKRLRTKNGSGDDHSEIGRAHV